MPDELDPQTQSCRQPKPSNLHIWFAGALVLCAVVLTGYVLSDRSVKEDQSAAREAKVANLKATIAAQEKALAKQQLMLDHINGKDAASIRASAIPEAKKQLESGEYDRVLVSLARLWFEDLKRPDARFLMDKASEKTIKQRADFARDYENERLRDGEDYRVTTSGTCSTTLHITYAGMYRPIVYRMQHNDEFNIKLRELGFRKIYLTDGYEKYWWYEPVASRLPAE
jgi:hypothetical protein